MYNSFSLLTYPFFVVHSWNSLWAVTRCGRLLLHTTRPVKCLSETRWRWGAPTQTLHWFSISSDLVVLVHPRPIVSQIYSRNSDGEPFGWWLARIRMMIGEVILSLLQTKKTFHYTRQYLKSCFSYAFPSGVWLNTQLEAKSLSCPSPSGPLIRTDSALWKHWCGATAQKNEMSGCRLVLTQLTWVCKYAAVSHIWSICCSAWPRRCQRIAVKRQRGRASPVRLALVTQSISQLEGLVTITAPSQKAETGRLTLWATGATAASHLTLVRRIKEMEKIENCTSYLKDDDGDDGVSVQENMLRQMVFARKNHGCPKEYVKVGFWNVSVRNECEPQEERNSSEH